MTLYEDLGVARDATDAQIKAAYRKHARKLHPDRDGGDAAKMAAVNAAYNVLSDPAKRKHYDDTGSVNGHTQLTPEQRTELEVRAMFVKLVKHCADQRGNIVHNMQRDVRDAIAEGRKAVKKGKARLAKIEKRLHAVRGPDDNLVQQILQGVVNELHSAIANDEAQLTVLTTVRDMLNAYESDEEDAPPEPEEAGDIGEMLAAMLDGRRR